MKILFVDSVHPILEERLSALNCELDFDYKSSKKEIETKINQYQGLVIRSRFPIDSLFLNLATNLQFIARSGAGLENIDLAYAEEKGITVFSSPEGNMDAVGEQAVGMLLMLFNQLKKGDVEVRNGIWDREGNRGLEIAGKTIGIIGYGNMGQAFAKKLSGFDCKVIAYDKYKTNFTDNFVQEVDLQKFQQESDVISIHLPLTEETKYYINDSFITTCQKPFYLINTARGNHVQTSALVNGLKTKKVLGACLDVLEYETKSFETINSKELPEDFKYLCSSNNIILSPHVAGWTKESYIKLSSFLADKIENTYFK
jgi:D-3-phosphoglycerate dehydrogenase